MFFLSKLFTFLFLPPGLFVLLALALIVLYIRRQQKLVLLFLILQLLLLYGSSITPVQNALLLPLEDSYPPLLEDSLQTVTDSSKRHDDSRMIIEVEIDASSSDDIEVQGGDEPVPSLRTPGYIVILGGGTTPSSPAEGGKSAPSRASLKRIVHGYSLYRQTGLPVITSGGIVYRGDHGEPEAETARRTLMKLGMLEGGIIVEPESRNTWENARNTAEIVGDETVILVTSAYHMRRSVLSFEKFGVEVVPAPTDYQTVRAPYTIIDYLPEIGNLKNFYSAVHEYIGLLYYQLKRGPA